MSFGKIKDSTISLDDILNKVTEADILNHYFGISALPILVNSPLRKDNNASLSIFINEKNNIIFKDFGTNKTYNIWSFLSNLWNKSYNDTLKIIFKDLPSMKSTLIKFKLKKSKKKVVFNKAKIECKIRDWKDYDLEYWNSQGISLEFLKFGNIYPISYIFVTKNNKTYRFAAEKYAYAYIEKKDNIVTMKIYQPKSDIRKWINSNDNSVWDLWTKLPKNGDILFITSSRKDALCLWENTNIPSTSLQGEGYIPKEKVINQLKQRFKKIYIFFDNDFDKEENYGRNYAIFLSKLFDIPFIEIPSEYKCKDPSDLYKKLKNKEQFKQIILNLIS